MTLITLALAGYITLGWFGLLVKKSFLDFIFWLVLLSGILWLVFVFLANWLQVNQELLFLFAIGIGSMGFLGRFRVMPNIVFLLFLGGFGYHWYTTGFFPTLYLFLLASVIGGVVVQTPLNFLDEYYEKITTENQMAHAYIFSVIGFGNIILFYIMRGI